MCSELPGFRITRIILNYLRGRAFYIFNIGEKISFIIGFKNNLILVVSKKKVILVQELEIAQGH